MTNNISNLEKSNVELKQHLGRWQRATQALLATKDRLKRLLASSPAVIYSCQAAGSYGIIFVSESIRQFGYQPQDFLENFDLWKECIHPDDVDYALSESSDLIHQTQQIFEYRFRHKDGDFRWIQDQRNLILDEAGNSIEIIGSWQDITEHKYIEQALFQEKELAQNILQSIGDGVITTDAQGQIQYINAAAEQITGYTLEAAIGKPLSWLIKSHEKNHSGSINHALQTAKSLSKVVNITADQAFVLQGSQPRTIDGSVAPIRNRKEGVIGTVVVFRDITQNRVLARQLSWQASHDFLTGLLNRRDFEQQLAQAIDNTRTHNKKHSLCYLDLDQFKVVNDTCGHAAGDELLRQLARLMGKQLRSNDVLARIGGDEFGIILQNCSLDNAVGLTDKLLHALQGFRFVWHDNTFSIGASAGLVEINQECGDINSVLGAADAACFAAKNQGRNRFHVYRSNDEVLTTQRGERQWVARILKALEEDRFCLYQQAIVPIHTTEGGVTHHELLLRMISETGEVIPPMAFVPAAERYGLMPKLDRWVISSFFNQYQIRQQANTMQAEHAQGPDYMPLYCINLSGMSINDDYLAAFLKEQFTLHEILPQTICFEITETAAITNLSRAADLIQEIKNLGCAFALDDFGSGMSSLAYLKTLPVDYVKIDGNFIRNIIQDPVDSVMVESITRIGHELGIQTIAEFVENEEILAKLRLLGVDYAQGYGIGHPVPFRRSQGGTPYSLG
ncbi:EAL domain-containing protein [Leptothoe kymatousa]|uniref:EAL domain-containing protein n=1 Tax=Leptothoe kymatousa TAU-MAC 1615 TaxID=2364775 RepID=A0ABS5Y1R7_9CYAN|nr:EAL domain-containing protein [Leptothoe kymatousa]MBT9310945.1 EAL domain-containing protein [Leptothoe kymatousa TAU-MAC 1615]